MSCYDNFSFQKIDMMKAQTFIDLLGTNLAYLFHRYSSVRNKQKCSHKLVFDKNLMSTNLNRKVRINTDKYNYLFNSIFSQRTNNNLEEQLRNNQRKRTNAKSSSFNFSLMFTFHIIFVLGKSMSK